MSFPPPGLPSPPKNRRAQPVTRTESGPVLRAIPAHLCSHSPPQRRRRLDGYTPSPLSRESGVSATDDLDSCSRRATLWTDDASSLDVTDAYMAEEGGEDQVLRAKGNSIARPGSPEPGFFPMEAERDLTEAEVDVEMETEDSDVPLLAQITHLAEEMHNLKRTFHSFMHARHALKGVVVSQRAQAQAELLAALQCEPDLERQRRLRSDAIVHVSALDSARSTLDRMKETIEFMARAVSRSQDDVRRLRHESEELSETCRRWERTVYAEHRAR